MTPKYLIHQSPSMSCKNSCAPWWAILRVMPQEPRQRLPLIFREIRRDRREGLASVALQ
jgi:hypothetical protein